MNAEGQAIKRFERNFRGMVFSFSTSHGLDREDMMQEARLGILRAIRTYDDSRDCTLSTYMYECVLSRLKHVARDKGPIRIPAWVQEKNSDNKRHGREPIPIPTCVCLSDSGWEAMDRLSGQEDVGYSDVDRSLALQDLLQTVDPKNIPLVWMRYVEERTESDIAKQVGLAHWKVRYELKKSTRNVRRDVRARHLNLNEYLA